MKLNGMSVIINNKIGDGYLECNQRTYDMLDIDSQSPIQANLSDKNESLGKGLPNVNIITKTLKYTKEELYDLTIKEQQHLLKEYGQTTWQIRKLHFEKQRVNKLLQLQEE